MHTYWNEGGVGSWWWMAVMMILFWGGIIWIAVAVIRYTGRPHLPPAAGPAETRSAGSAAQEILAERLARGEIEPDEYRQRLDALDHRSRAQT